MNANTSVGLGYSELIDSHRAGLQMEWGFLTKSPWAQHGGRRLPPSPPPALRPPPPSLDPLGPKHGDDGGGRAAGSWVDNSPERKGLSRKMKAPHKPSSAQALQRHLYVIRNASLPRVCF